MNLDQSIILLFALELAFSQSTMLDRSKHEEYVDNNFKFDENGRKFSKMVETTVGEGEIACYEQFLFFPKCFHRTCTADT